MTRRALAVSLVAAALSRPPLARAQQPPDAPVVAAPVTLAVTGAVTTPLTLSAADLKAMPRTTVLAPDDNRTVTYEGVLVGEILRRAGAPVGEALRGDAVASYVVAHGIDGYRAVYALAELDDAFTPSNVIVADTIDGRPLFAYQGRWRLVAPKDLRGARSVRLLHRLEVVRLPR